MTGNHANGHLGPQTASGHLVVDSASRAPYPEDVLGQLNRDAALVMARYPQQRSALLPLLHLVQSVDGYVSGRGIRFCADLLDLSTAEVSGVATFYTQYKRHPNGRYTVGVCINTLCAIMGGDQIWEAVSEHLGIGHDETTDDGAITLERIECNAACDYAPVVMANWEFFDNQTVSSAVDLVDDLRAGRAVTPTRGADTVCTFRQVSRVLAGFPDGRADEGVGAGGPSLEGLRVAKERGWSAPRGGQDPQDRHQPEATSHEVAAGRHSSTDTPSNAPDESAGDAARPTDTARPTATPRPTATATDTATGKEA